MSPQCWAPSQFVWKPFKVDTVPTSELRAAISTSALLTMLMTGHCSECVCVCVRVFVCVFERAIELLQSHCSRQYRCCCCCNCCSCFHCWSKTHRFASFFLSHYYCASSLLPSPSLPTVRLAEWSSSCAVLSFSLSLSLSLFLVFFSLITCLCSALLFIPFSLLANTAAEAAAAAQPQPHSARQALSGQQKQKQK